MKNPVSVQLDALVSAPFLADLLGIGEHQVRHLAAEQVIPKVERGKYPFGHCIRGYVEALRKAAQGQTPDESLREERRLLTRAKRETAELQIRRMTGEVILLADARRFVATVATATRVQLEIWPSRIAAEFAAELGVDEGRMLRGLERRVREFLREAAKEPPPELGLRA